MADRAHPVLDKMLQLEGGYVTARLISGKTYLVLFFLSFADCGAQEAPQGGALRAPLRVHGEIQGGRLQQGMYGTDDMCSYSFRRRFCSCLTSVGLCEPLEPQKVR